MLKKEERGITLVSLIITIIVLLILAGVTLNGLFGDSGIISNAEKAKENTEISNEKEIIKKASTAVIAKNRAGDVTVVDMQEEMDKSMR